jgi:GxxExxY protein
LIAKLEKREIPFETQKGITVLYREITIGTDYLDLVIGGKIIIELKAVASLNNLFKQQLLSYLKATGLQLGILINFGSRRVEYIRITNKVIIRPIRKFVLFVIGSHYAKICRCH